MADELEADQEATTARLPPPVVPEGPQDLVVSRITLALSETLPTEVPTSPPTSPRGKGKIETQPLELELAFANGIGKVLTSTSLEFSGGQYVCTRLAVAQQPDLCLHVRVVGSTAPLFETPIFLNKERSPSSLGLRGLAGSVSSQMPASEAEQPKGFPKPKGLASLTCLWRLQRTLMAPKNGLDRCPSLSMQYSAPHSQNDVVKRLELWVQEMNEVSGVDPTTEEDNMFFRAEYAGRPPYFVYKAPTSWTHDWKNPYIPHHMRGDPQTVATRKAYIDGAAECKALFRAQAVQVKLQILKDALPSCTTALEAVQKLESIHTFLETSDNLLQIDALATLKVLRRLHLPFERLVRNVWEEGPEVKYDFSKAALEKLLMREVTRRRSEKTKLSASQSRIHAMPVRHTYQCELINETLAQLNRAKPSSTNAIRRGLLTFKGQSVAVEQKTKEFGS